MKYLLLLIFFLISYCSCTVQKKVASLQCGGLSILGVGLAIEGFAPCSHCDISINSLKDGFSFTLIDSNYKIIGLEIAYTNNKDEVTVKRILGSRITSKNVEFLKNIEIGNFISIGCINIKKNGKRALSTGMLIYVTK